MPCCVRVFFVCLFTAAFPEAVGFVVHQYSTPALTPLNHKTSARAREIHENCPGETEEREGAEEMDKGGGMLPTLYLLTRSNSNLVGERMRGGHDASHALPLVACFCLYPCCILLFSCSFFPSPSGGRGVPFPFKLVCFVFPHTTHAARSACSTARAHAVFLLVFCWS